MQQHTVNIRFVSEPLSTWVSMVSAPGEILFNRAAIHSTKAAFHLLASVYAALGETHTLSQVPTEPFAL